MPIVGLLPESVGRQRDHKTRRWKRGMLRTAPGVPRWLRGRRMGAYKSTAATDAAAAAGDNVAVVVRAASNGRGSRPRYGSGRRGRRRGQRSGDQGNG